jgi:hypothetical protein
LYPAQSGHAHVWFSRRSFSDRQAQFQRQVNTLFFGCQNLNTARLLLDLERSLGTLLIGRWRSGTSEDHWLSFNRMNVFLFRRAADYGGILNAALCGVHCAAGPVLLAWCGTHHAGAVAERLEVVFLVLSGVLVALATWRQSSIWLRLALWVLFAAFTTAALLAERCPGMELVQYGASVGLIGAHLLNQRHCHRCVADCPTPLFSQDDRRCCEEQSRLD